MAGARQGCSEAQGASKSGKGLPQSKTQREFGGKAKARDKALAQVA